MLCSNAWLLYGVSVVLFTIFLENGASAICTETRYTFSVEAVFQGTRDFHEDIGISKSAMATTRRYIRIELTLAP